MIVVEDKLTELFDMIPSIQVNSNNLKKPVFSWGKKEELNRYVELYKSNLYPLIWLLPTEDTYNISSNLVTKRVVLILSTLETRQDILNPQRYRGSFEQVLNPLASYVVQALQNSSITRITNPDSITILKEPNYSDAGENATIDLWDAIRIECDVEFNNNCLKPIKWK